PTVLTAMPRLLEKVQAGVEEKGRRPGLEGRLAAFACATARAYARERFGPRGEAGLGLMLRQLLADLLVLRRVRALLGGRLRTIVTGGAAHPVACTEFFTGVGVRVLPGYGLTEHAPVISFNTPRAFRFGTVGRPLPGVETRIAEDGEVLVRGP